MATIYPAFLRKLFYSNGDRVSSKYVGFWFHLELVSFIHNHIERSAWAKEKGIGLLESHPKVLKIINLRKLECHLNISMFLGLGEWISILNDLLEQKRKGLVLIRICMNFFEWIWVYDNQRSPLNIKSFYLLLKDSFLLHRRYLVHTR